MSDSRESCRILVKGVGCMEDARILELFFQRSAEAIPAVAEKYEGLIFQIAQNILENWQDADECVNDTYLGLWNAIPPHRPDPFLAFVCRIARNVALNRYRSVTARKRSRALEASLEELELDIPSPSVEEVVSARELGRAIDRFLDTLDESSRALFVRRYWFSDPVSHLAREFFMTENHVSVKLHRLRKRLKHFLEQEGVIL